jgi:hypothetical protein
MGLEYPVQLSSVAAQILLLHGSPRGLSSTEIQVLGFYTDLIMQDIEDGTPVDTGFLRDGWEVELRTTSGDIGFTIVNDVDYASFAHRKGETDPVWMTLIPESIASHQAAMLAGMEKAIRATEAGIDRRNAAAIRRATLTMRPR